MTNIWEALTQDRVIDAVQNVVGEDLSGLCLKRNSYINRVFELEEKQAKNRLIVKFYRPNRWTKEMILEEHSFINKLFELENHVIPPLQYNGETLFEDNGIYFAVFPKKGGRALDEFDQEGWINIGRIIGMTHLAASKDTGSMRVIWKPDVATEKHRVMINDLKALPEDFAKSFNLAANAFIEKSSPSFGKIEMFKLHGDVHMGNLIHRPNEGTFIVDFDDMCTGPPVQDMWMLLPDTVENCNNEIEWFISGYETFISFDRKSLDLIPYLRAMRMIHFASWCAVQKDDKGFDDHFPQWGTKKYWGELIRDIRGIIEG